MNPFRTLNALTVSSFLNVFLGTALAGFAPLDRPSVIVVGFLGVLCGVVFTFVDIARSNRQV